MFSSKEVELMLYNKEFEPICPIDTFFSLVWTNRFQEASDFELQISPFSDVYKLIQRDYYIYNPNSEHLMIIEKIQVESNIENGSTVLVSGRSLESLLDRRVVWYQTWFAGSITTGIKLLLDTNIINPKDEKRKIPNFEWGGCLIGTEKEDDLYSSPEKKPISKIGIDYQLMGDNIYDYIVDVCKTYNLGFKVTWRQSDNHFIFYLCKGIDRSETNHDGNLVVEFSSNNDNLLSSNFAETAIAYKNVAIIGGEGDGDKQKFMKIYENSYSGMDRKETYVDGSDKSQEVDGHKLTDAEYNRQLREAGKMELKNVEDIETFEGEVQADENSMFQFGKDIFIGDLASVKNEYGKKGSCIVLETVESYDTSGYFNTPTFLNVKPEVIKLEGTVNITAANQVFQLTGLGNRNLTCEWGDGAKSISLAEIAAHTYTQVGEYDFKIYYTDLSDFDFCPKFSGQGNTPTILEKLDLPNGVQSIPENAFKGCSGLAELYLPSSITSIAGNNAFEGCTGLYELVLPNGITSLGEYFFKGCTNLVSVNFPYSCKNVPRYFFDGCNKIRSLDFPGNTIADKGVEVIGEFAMNGCTRLRNITFGSKVVTINGNCTTGTNKDLSIECMRWSETEPKISALTSAFAVGTEKKVSSITVPTSPKWDDTVLNAYKQAENWRVYDHDDIIQEKDEKEEEDK